MKKLSLFLLAAFTLIAMSGCNESDRDYPNYANFVSVYKLGGTDYYFKTDNGKTLYPSDKSRVGAYTAKEHEPAQRAVVYYNTLPVKAEGYDYNIQPYLIVDLYTNAAKVVSTTEELEALSDAKTSYINCRMNRNFLTLEVAYPVSDNSKHTFDLIVDATDPDKKPTTDGYLDLELRHNTGGDTSGVDEGFYISFDMAAIKDRLEGKKGITLRVNTQLNGVKLIKIDLPGEE